MVSRKEIELMRVLDEVRKQMSYTVLSYEQRDPNGSVFGQPDYKWGDPGYNGNCSGKIPLGFIDKLAAKSVCELYAGSGTLSDVCRDYNIPYCGIDLNPNPVRENIVAMDILDLNQELPDAFYEADMCFSHPPYPGLNHVKYAGHAWRDDGNLAKRDIQNMPFERGMQMVNLSTMRAYSALPAGSYMVILVGEIRAGGKYYSMYQNLTLPGEVFQTYVKLQHNTWSGRQSYSGKKNLRALTNHEMIVVVKKPSGYEIAYVIPREYVMDIRDSVKTATWKDVVYAVMRNIGHEASMEEIYSAIGSHKKAKANADHWREKVRQTLQMLAKNGKVINVRRGCWAVA